MGVLIKPETPGNRLGVTEAPARSADP